jgi:hypothetical protein
MTMPVTIITASKTDNAGLGVAILGVAPSVVAVELMPKSPRSRTRCRRHARRAAQVHCASGPPTAADLLVDVVVVYL